MDPILKRLFGHAEVVEILVRGVLPDHADRIDLSTLEKASAEQVGEALARRYADMIWTARTRDGTGLAVILTEFQGKPDRLMSLRPAVYSHLAVQELLQRVRPALRPDAIEVLPPVVIYHGPGAWKAPTALGDVFPRGIPREFRVIQRDPAGGGSATAIDLVGAMTGLHRDTSMKGALAELGRLRKIAAETGDRLDGLLADCVGARSGADVLAENGGIPDRSFHLSPRNKEKELPDGTGTPGSVPTYYPHQLRETADETTFLSVPFPSGYRITHQPLSGVGIKPGTTKSLLSAFAENEMGISCPPSLGRGPTSGNGGGPDS